MRVKIKNPDNKILHQMKEYSTYSDFAGVCVCVHLHTLGCVAFAAI